MTALIGFNLFKELLQSIPVMLYYAFFGLLRQKVPIRRKRFFAACGINFAAHAAILLLFQQGVMRYVITFAELVIAVRILWGHLKRTTFWFTFFFAMVLEVLLECIPSVLYQAICKETVVTVEWMGKSAMFLRPETLPVLLVLTYLIPAPLMLIAFFKKKPTIARKPAPWTYLVRFALVFLLIVAILMLYGDEFDNITWNGVSFLKENLLRLILYGIGVALLIFYGWQDIRQYRLLRQNEALIEQNGAYQRVLESTREFRHNVSNMIYGLEGVVLSGNAEALNAYYQEMVHRCALINEENAVSINRLSDASLAALLLRKLDAAREREIPVYLTVHPGFRFNALPAHVLCEILGNLLDNALEAAEKAEAPEVVITLDSSPEYDEILIANTFSKDANLSFLTGEAVSSKENHRATGLQSVRRILKRQSGVCMNQYLQGRFIETSLCSYK